MNRTTAGYVSAVFWIFGVGCLLVLSLRLLGIVGGQSDAGSFIVLWIGLATLFAANWMKAQLANGDEADNASAAEQDIA